MQYSGGGNIGCKLMMFVCQWASHCRRIFVLTWPKFNPFRFIKVQVLCENGLIAEAKQVAEKATLQSSSLSLWSMFCQLMYNEDGFEDVCRKALKNVPPKVY